MKLNFIFLATFIILITSCNKEDLKPTDSGFTIEDGVIYFKNSDVFYETMDLLNPMDNEDIENWLVENKFFNSLYFKLKEMEECGEYVSDELSLTPDNIHDAAFAALLNEDGLISIGDTLSFITKSMEYVITNGDKRLVNAIKKNPDMESEHLIRFDLSPNLKSSYKAILYDEYDSLYTAECELWVEVWFWKHTSTIEVDMYENSSTNTRPTMAYCYMSISGDWVSYKDSDTNRDYVHLTYSGSKSNCKEHQYRIYSKGWKGGHCCAKNVEVSASIQKEGDTNSNSVSFSYIPYVICSNSD
ncbi:MAG: hypothetical protein JXB49_04805 [Bacteroidales bacterium]|nr:hypothetical protein [Bacteroidales bacterium]